MQGTAKMTVNEIYDEVKKNGIPVGLDAWMPKKLEKKVTTWTDYIPDDIKALNAEVQKERERKEKEALEIAKMYFGDFN